MQHFSSRFHQCLSFIYIYLWASNILTYWQNCFPKFRASYVSQWRHSAAADDVRTHAVATESIRSSIMLTSKWLNSIKQCLSLSSLLVSRTKLYGQISIELLSLSIQRSGTKRTNDCSPVSQ